MKFGLRCFTCGKGFDPTDSHAEIWCDGENVVTLCPGCTVASDLRIDVHHRGSGERYTGMAAEKERGPHLPTHADGPDETFIWDALKRMQERADEFRRRGPGAS